MKEKQAVAFGHNDLGAVCAEPPRRSCHDPRPALVPTGTAGKEGGSGGGVRGNGQEVAPLIRQVPPIEPSVALKRPIPYSFRAGGPRCRTARRGLPDRALSQACPRAAGKQFRPCSRCCQTPAGPRRRQAGNGGEAHVGVRPEAAKRLTFAVSPLPSPAPARTRHTSVPRVRYRSNSTSLARRRKCGLGRRR